ncbi:MAG TPA: ATP-binding protein [Ktedonobacterales bacterium]
MSAPQQQIERRLLTVFRAFVWALWALLSLGACALLGRHGGYVLRLWLRQDGAGGWVLTVSDDGAGFDPSAAPTRRGRHYGVTGMRERAALIGATFEVRSRPGGGTAVILHVPAAAGLEGGRA